MDPIRHGKRPLPSDEPEKKEEEENIFSCYSARSQHDMTAMVSALTQVITNTTNHDKTTTPPDDLLPHNPLALARSSAPEPSPSQPGQDQGNNIHVIHYLMFDKQEVLELFFLFYICL